MEISFFMGETSFDSLGTIYLFSLAGEEKREIKNPPDPSEGRFIIVVPPWFAAPLRPHGQTIIRPAEDNGRIPSPPTCHNGFSGKHTRGISPAGSLPARSVTRGSLDTAMIRLLALIIAFAVL